MFRIGRNEAVEIIRRRRRTVVAEAPEECLGTDPLIDRQPAEREVMGQKERLQSLDKAIAQLLDAEREVLALRLQGDLPIKEIAQVIDVPLGTVLARMHRAKKRVKFLLESESNE